MTENTGSGVRRSNEVGSSGAAPFMDPLDQKQKSLLGETLRDPDCSLLRKWLTGRGLNKPDIAWWRAIRWWRARRWRKIGWEVFERKALLLAAARDLEENDISDPMKLAATDIFVEKAQVFLTTRGRALYVFGVLTSVLAIGLLLGAAWFAYGTETKKLLDVANSSDDVSPAYLTILILKSITASGFVVGVAYFFVSLSKALLHEATVLYSQRHSLRFGRLFVYLKSDTMTRDDLEVIFNWNTEFSTAFKDIKAEDIMKSPLTRAIEAPVEGVKVMAELWKEIRAAQEEREKEKNREAQK